MTPSVASRPTVPADKLVTVTLGNVWVEVQVLAWERLSEATTVPVVGVTVSVESELETEPTEPPKVSVIALGTPPSEEPQTVLAGKLPEHWPKACIGITRKTAIRRILANIVPTAGKKRPQRKTP